MPAATAFWCPASEGLGMVGRVRVEGPTWWPGVLAHSIFWFGLEDHVGACQRAPASASVCAWHRGRHRVKPTPNRPPHSRHAAQKGGRRGNGMRTLWVRRRRVQRSATQRPDSHGTGVCATTSRWASSACPTSARAACSTCCASSPARRCVATLPARPESEKLTRRRLCRRTVRRDAHRLAVCH